MVHWPRAVLLLARRPVLDALLLCIAEITWRWCRSNLSAVQRSCRGSFDDPRRQGPIRTGLPMGTISSPCPPSPLVYFPFSPRRRTVSNHHIVNSLTEQSLITFIWSIVDHHSLYSPGWLQYSYSHTTKRGHLSINTAVTVYKTPESKKLSLFLPSNTPSQWHI